jgi:hypothetical protein
MVIYQLLILFIKTQTDPTRLIQFILRIFRYEFKFHFIPNGIKE